MVPVASEGKSNAISPYSSMKSSGIVICVGPPTIVRVFVLLSPVLILNETMV